MADRNIADLDPALQTIAQACLAAWVSTYPSRKPVAIVQTWRSSTDQQAAYDAGLSNAKPGESKHECCLPDGTAAARAFDYACFTDDGNYIADGTHPYYTDFANIAKSQGLSWGGDFHSFQDFDHVELPT